MPRILRDRVTWLIYAQLGAWGYFLYGFGPIVPLLRDENHVSSAVAGLHSTAMAAGSILGGAVAPVLLRRFGRGTTMWAALVAVSAGVIALISVRGLEFTIPIIFLISLTGITLITGVVASLNEKHGPAAPAAITEANAVAVGAGLVAPLVIGLSVSAGFGWRPGLLSQVLVVAVLALSALALRVRVPAGTVAPAAPSGQRRPLGRAYWYAWTMMAVTGAVEAGFSLWAADVLRTHAGMSAGAAAQSISAIVAGMFLGRAAGARIALRVPPIPLYLVALSTSTVGFFLFWSSSDAVVAVLGLLVLGLGNAMHYPIAIALAMQAAPDQPDRAAASASYSMGLSFGAGPLILAALADAVGVRAAFLLIPLMLAFAAALAWMLRRAMAPAPEPALVLASEG